LERKRSQQEQLTKTNYQVYSDVTNKITVHQQVTQDT